MVMCNFDVLKIVVRMHLSRAFYSFLVNVAEEAFHSWLIDIVAPRGM